MKRLLGILLLSAFVLAHAPARAQAQEYPSKTVRILVGFAPGGATDILARLVAKHLSEQWSQPVIVENRPGAGGNIAHEAVAKAEPDGHTLLFTSAPLTINPSLYRNLPYDTVRDFAPVTLVATVPSLLLVPSASKITTFDEFVRHVRAKPGSLNYGSAGNGTPQHLAMELLKSMADLRIVHIPYKGGAPAVADLISGQTDVMFAAFPEAAPHVRANRLKALAISASKRSPLMPDLPTVAESGVRGFEAVGWQGLLAPAATPRPVVEKIHQTLARGLAQPELRSRIDAMGIEFSGAGPQPYQRFIRDEVAKWAKVVEQSGARID
ncbi:MAG TPA: tripartite tricarboxylate transporter substrate binding protein [Burkholderiaceae bacterium]|nr:tripartite tricarboxylate transporter substrate binding protein [Burkholderiaceae bacterium]